MPCHHYLGRGEQSAWVSHCLACPRFIIYNKNYFQDLVLRSNKSVLQFRGPNTHFRASAKGICNHPILLKFSQYVSFESSYLNG